MDKTITQVCKCEKCGNEAEMQIVCTLPDLPDAHNHNYSHDNKSESLPNKVKDKLKDKVKDKVKGTATCSHCGGEADMWIDF